MSPFHPDASWYERYWFTPKPAPLWPAWRARILAASQRVAAMLLSAAWAITTVGAVH
jgi:hypothetical protein